MSLTYPGPRLRILLKILELVKGLSVSLTMLCCLTWGRPRNPDGFSPVSLERVLKLINWSNGRCQDFTQHSDSLQTCHFSPSGTLLFTVAFNEILLWDVHDLWGVHLSVVFLVFLLLNRYVFINCLYWGNQYFFCRMFTFIMLWCLYVIFLWLLKCNCFLFFFYMWKIFFCVLPRHFFYYH